MKSFNQIENDIDVSQIKHKEYCIWPIVKSYLIAIEGKNNEILKETSGNTIKLLFKNLFLDVVSIFKIFRADIWVFTNSERRYEINNSHFERVASGLIKYFDRYVLFENPIPKGKTKKENLQKGEYLIGMSWIYLIQYIMMKLSRTPKINRLTDFEKYLNADLNKIKKIYHRYHIGYIFYKAFFRIKRPKAVFLVCYYSNFGLIRACKEKKIPVFELQHGIVTKEHRAYNFHQKYGQIFFPDYFLGFGNYFNEIVVKGNLVKKKHTLNYGYSFLYEVSDKMYKSDDLNKIQKKFDKVICITGQLESTDIHLLKVLGKITDKFPEIYFIFKPRNKEYSIPFLEKSNFVKWEGVNTYQLLKYCDLHITIYSTCALESIALGTPNISIDIDGLYTKYLKELIHNNKYNFYARDESDLEAIIKELKDKKFKRKEVSRSIKEIMAPMISKELFFNFFQHIVENKSRH